MATITISKRLTDRQTEVKSTIYIEKHNILFKGHKHYQRLIYGKKKIVFILFISSCLRKEKELQFFLILFI